MYNMDYPPTRHVRANGKKGAPFNIFSGVPQGCPASPLIFLIIAEALTRAIEQDINNYKHLEIFKEKQWQQTKHTT